MCSCGTYAHYGPNGVGICCTKCKKPGMKHITRHYCEENCGTIACFGFYKRNPRFCFKHKKEGMYNVMSRRCLECNKTASFCHLGSKTVLFCRKHAKPEMICRSSMMRKKKERKILCQTEVCYMGTQLNPDGTIKSWGIKIEHN